MKNIITTFKSTKQRKAFSKKEKVFWKPKLNYKIKYKEKNRLILCSNSKITATPVNEKVCRKAPQIYFSVGIFKGAFRIFFLILRVFAHHVNKPTI